MSKLFILLISLVTGFLIYSKNSAIGFLIILFSLIGFLSTYFSKKENKAKSKDYKIVEPIIIESTRQLPYKIPSKMNLTYSPNAKQRKPWWKKATGKGIVPIISKSIGKFLKDL